MVNNKNILYVSNDKILVKDILFQNNVDISPIEFCDLSSLNYSNRDFDLLILDDVTGISLFDDNYIKDFVDSLSIPKKIIISMKKMQKENVIYEINKGLSLFKEPRSIQTKINLNHDMPHVVFDFLKWFIANNTKVIIITKDYESCENVYNYMKKYVLIYSKLRNVYIHSEFESFGEFVSLNKDESYIYITTIFSLSEINKVVVNNKSEDNNFNILVFFASSKSFNYKMLLNICGMGNFLTNCKNEIIFVSNYENIEIIMAKVISRSYNKKLWESGMRKY